MSDQALLVGGRSDGTRVEPAVLRLKVNYPDGTWDTYEHIDLGDAHPIVLRSHSDPVDREAIIARYASSGVKAAD